MALFSEKILQAKRKALRLGAPFFEKIDEVAEKNTLKVLSKMREHKISEHHFGATSGYAYDDAGREKLEAVWAGICGAEKALVRAQFVSGTHALASVLFGILRPGDELLAVTGAPYDTMQTVIGRESPSPGSLKEFGVGYDELPMVGGKVDLGALANKIKPNTKVALIQRSRGYSMRSPLSIAEISEICRIIKSVRKDCVCFVDNCYGEFVEELEPTEVGADIMAGSLIKNPGGGIAPTGGYAAGRAELVELAAYRLTAPGIGSEQGASLSGNRLFFQGLFLAPHVVAQALKSAVFASLFFGELGYRTLPEPQEARGDIIQAIELGDPKKMIAFCRGLQNYSPVDSHVCPEPWAMPGYRDQVVMAAGTFVQGASIELSADGPIRPPYAVYLQGALTFEHGVVGAMGAAQAIEEIE